MGKNNEHRQVYLDYAASTPVDTQVLAAMEPYWSEHFANPGGLHTEAVKAREAVEHSRSMVADGLGAQSSEVIFTSGGTESNNLAILGVVAHHEKKGRDITQMHFVTSAIEHHSVLDVFRELERRGATVSVVGVLDDGVIDVATLKEMLRPETVMVSVMYANNEIGTIQPVAEITKIVRHHKKTHQGSPLVFHTDASQSPLYLDVNVRRLDVDLMTFGGQKIYAPKGVGAVYIKKGVMLAPLFFGGKHEQCLRPGTENVPLVVGFGEAFVRAVKEQSAAAEEMAALQDFFIESVLERVPSAVLNGSRDRRLPNNINFSIPHVDNEWLTIQLDAKGIAIGTRSACLEGGEVGSHVVTALGRDVDSTHGSFRFTMGRGTTKEDLAYVADTLAELVKNK